MSIALFLDAWKVERSRRLVAETLLTVLELVKAGTCSVDLQLAVLELISLLSVARDSRAMFQRCRILDTVVSIAEHDLLPSVSNLQPRELTHNPRHVQLVLKDTRESTGAVRRAATKLLLSLAQDMPSASSQSGASAPGGAGQQPLGPRAASANANTNTTQQQKESSYGSKRPDLRSMSLDIRGALTGADR